MRAPPLILLASAALVIATHPEPWSGWAVWALSPVAVYWLVLVCARGVAASAAVTLVYSSLFGLAAGFGDESYTDVARVVYLFLPFCGLAGIVVASTIAAAMSMLRAPAARTAPPPRRASVLAGLAVAAVWIAGAQLGRPEVVVAQSRGGAPAAVASLRCEGDDTRLLTPEVAAQRDGVHVRVENASGHEIELEYEIDGGAGGGGGEVLERGTSVVVVPFAARTVGFACLDERPATPEHATARVRDARGVARAPQLDCTRPARAERVHAEPTAEVVRRTRDLLRERGLLRTGDRLVRAVPIAGEFPVVLLLRGGRAVAMVSFRAVAPDRYAAMDLDACA